MGFQSLEFIVFLVIVFFIYWKLPQRGRWCWLLLTGYCFYTAFNWKYSFLLLGMTLFAFGTARRIEEAAFPKRKLYLAFYTAVVLGVLGIYKYLGFAADILQSMAEFLNIPLELSLTRLLLPVGISFYLFQTMGYVFDVYYGKIKAEKHVGYFAASVAFFPILLSGPIERIQRLTEQLRKEKQFSYEEGQAAVRQIIAGYLKKLIIADGISTLTNAVYSDVHSYSGFVFILVIFGFSIQIYCDFSGYSDIAIGVARLFGIQIQENFRQPYFADSIKDFWRRWHISLSGWFRDYVYIPLGGNRVSEWKKNRNLMLTFLLSGLWHGAGWTFPIWGGLHGIMQMIGNKWKGFKERCFPKVRIPKVMSRLGVFVLVSVAWVFFQADTLSDGCFVLLHCMDGVWNLKSYLQLGFTTLEMTAVQTGMLLFFVVILFLYDRKREKGQEIRFYGIKLILLVEMALFYYMRYGIDSGTFIYFQF